MAHIQLYHHAGNRGNAEKVRMMLEETGFKYDEIALDQAAFEEMKANKTLSWGALPAISDDGHFLEDSNAIMYYLAKKADKVQRGSRSNKYLGEDDEQAQVIAIAQKATEFQQIAQTWKGKDGAEPGFVGETIPKWFAYFQTVLAKNDDDDVRTEEFSFGKNFTFADISMFEAVNAVVNVHGLHCLRPFPKLKEFHDKVSGKARINKYISMRGNDTSMEYQ